MPSGGSFRMPREMTPGSVHPTHFMLYYWAGGVRNSSPSSTNFCHVIHCFPDPRLDGSFRLCNSKRNDNIDIHTMCRKCILVVPPLAQRESLLVYNLLPFRPNTGLSCTQMTSRWVSTSICSHISAGMAEASPESPKMSKFRCQNGLEIATKAWGSPSSDRRALALHGFIDNTGSFDLLGPALAARGIRVVAMDFPGHGKSDFFSRQSSYKAIKYPEYVLEAARSLGWDRFSLVGHSLGGAVGLLVAASFPELVERCVFIDALGPAPFSVATTPERFRRSIESRRVLLEKKPKTYASFDDAVKVRLKAVPQWGENQTMTWNAAARLVAGGTDPCEEGSAQVRFCHDILLRASNDMNFTEESILTYLRAIECPCLLVRGATGMVKDIPANLNRMATMGDRLQDLILPGSHHLHLDEETAPLVACHSAEFLLGGEDEWKPSPLSKL